MPVSSSNGGASAPAAVVKPPEQGPPRPRHHRPTIKRLHNRCRSVSLAQKVNVQIGRLVPNVSTTVVLRVLAVAGFCVAAELARRRPVLRFANVKVLESITPQPSTRWLHVPGILLAASLRPSTAAGRPARDVNAVRGHSVAGILSIRRLPG
jgi:hypothetical protein